MRAMVFSLVMALLAAAPAASRAQDVEIVSSTFGLFNTSPTGEMSFVPTTTVPRVTGQGYGWVIVLKTTKPSVHWREEFTLPDAATTWGMPTDGSAQTSVSADRKVAVTERDASLAEAPVIVNSWAIADGDPKGTYKIHVIVDGKLERDFVFNVE